MSIQGDLRDQGVIVNGWRLVLQLFAFSLVAILVLVAVS